MDPGTLAGIILGFVAIFASMILEGGNPAAIIAPGPLLLVFGGTFGVAMASGLMKDATGIVKVVKSALLAKKHDHGDSIAQLVSFAEKARREGLLALEEAARNVEDPFLKKGLELAVDGTDPEELRDILENELHAMKQRHKVGIKFFENMGGFAPTLGIIGTVLGLVHVLENLSDPGHLGPLIASAFIATLWGVMSANVMWLPMGNKLKRVSELEAHHRELVIEGILAIQAGANPRVIEQKLLTYLSPKERDGVDKEKGCVALSTRRKCREDDEEHVNHERWLITYADMITLLMVLFIVLFAIGQTDLKKFAQLRDSLNNTLGGKGGDPVFQGGEGPLSGSLNIAPKEKLGVQEVSAVVQREQQHEAAIQAQDHTFEEAKKQIQQQLDGVGLGATVQFHKEARGLIVSVVSDRVLFDPGKADLRPEGTQVLNGMAPALVTLPNAVTIEGHTDNRPISSALYPTNWELSTARATSVLRYLVTKGVPGNRLAAAGYADQKPIAANDTDAHRAENRRVEVVILSNVDDPVATAAATKES